jgi:transposase-like protein
MHKRSLPFEPSDPETLRAIPRACSDEREAILFLEGLRWNGKPFCPRTKCGSYDVYAMRDRASGERERHYRWRCRSCAKQFSVRTNTPMACTNLPAHVWMTALWMMTTSKKGVPALQIARMTGVTPKWALFLAHRIRHAVTDITPPRKLVGELQADECFIGGKPRNSNFKRKPKRATKTPVVAVVETGGEVRARVLKPSENVDAETLHAFLVDNADPNSRLMTDEWAGYRGLGQYFKGRHHRVNHSHYEYARKANGLTVTTNGIESFWSMLRRRMVVHHAVSVRHLARYVAEAQFAWNTRIFADADRLRMMVIRGEGKRLLYRRRKAA